ncbi:protein TASOR 2 [Pempheris klunzingeri]|uniref:protein TASOR 2 n=1 Tax=Pempheris klunzingeri TaxID=3127111 RepID=UPI0039816CA3
MESENGGASSKGVLVPVSTSSDVFQSSILAPLKSAYLYEESKHSFRYKSAVLIKNPVLEEKYNTFRAKRREAGYSEEDLKESYGFLLFDDINKANALGETGVLTGNSTCTTLGDPANGVYISVYSDCLDLNRWYHGKSGYIAIIRLTKGRVKKVLENYTQNFTAPTVGFDSHVSEQLPSVSAKTSSFLAFERTKYYMYELLDDGSNETTQVVSAACPFAIVSFSYTDTKAALVAPPEKSEEKKLVFHYFSWTGQLQIGTLFYDVGLRSTARAVIPSQLSPVVKVDHAISMSNLRRLLPRAVFETCFDGEVFLDSMYCSLCEFVSSAAEETSSLSQLLSEIKEKDVALTIKLNDGGFLILLHSSHFLRYDDSGPSATEVLQGMFVFPDSRVIQRDAKVGQRKPAVPSEILRLLPVLSYAEGELEKTLIDPSEELCDVLAQYMQSYTTLINPGLALSPSRDFSIFPDQYDVPDAHKHLYISPEWTNRGWQNFRSYLNKPASFQLPVSKASEILAAGEEEQIEDLDDDVYICLSSPEDAPASLVTTGSEDQLTDQKSPVNVETFVDSCITSAEAQVDITDVPQNDDPGNLQSGDAAKDFEKSDPTVLIKMDERGAKHLLTPSTSDDLPAELIVSITSAERTVTDESLSVIGTRVPESAAKYNDFQLSVLSTDKLPTTNSLNDESVKTKEVLDCPEVTSLTKTKYGKLHRGHSKVREKTSKACVETPNSQAVKVPEEDNSLTAQKEDQAMESLGLPQLRNASNTDWRRGRRRKCKFGKLSSKNKKVRSATAGPTVAEEKKSDQGQQNFESTFLKELEACPLRKKMERWDLKPVISECGRILVPHGFVDNAQIKSLKDKLQSTKDGHCPDKMLVDASGNAHDALKMENESSPASEIAMSQGLASASKNGGNRLQNIVSHVNPEHSFLRQSDDGNGSMTLNPESSVHHTKNDARDTSPSKADQGKHTDTLSPGQCATKGQLLLSKLKSVLLRGKRKSSLLISEKTTANTTEDNEPSIKMSKVDSEMLKSNDAITSVQDTSMSVKVVSKMLSVDPLFAFALGLTPKETLYKMQKTEDQDTQQRKDSVETQVQTIFDKQPQILQRPPSIFPRGGRIKTLRKHQGISAEYVKKKWWLHFQTPACFASEKVKYKECTRDNSVRKPVKEKMNSACTSTDALNLLADLALSVSNDQIPPQPNPALERNPETSLKKCDLTKDVTSAEQESVLHALLRQPASRPSQPLESPSPSPLVGGSELVDLVSKEHAYSLPPSSSLLLDLPGTPFQVSPLIGSSRLLQHHQTMHGDGVKTLHPTVCQEDGSEHNRGTSKYMKKHMVRRRKFKHSRTFVNKDGSLQVTKQWKENYDFNLDSKFTSDSKDRAIIRALHGPWDFSVQDTSEEVKLIVHMWIGLFYSRSTARFFHFDSFSKDSESCKSSGKVSAPAQSELKANSTTPLPSVRDASDPLNTKALDLRKKDHSFLDQESVILDLSLKNSRDIDSSDPQVHGETTPVSGDCKEASESLNTLKSSIGLQESSTTQCYRNATHPTEVISYENKRICTPSQKAVVLGHTDEPSFKAVGKSILIQEEVEGANIQPKNNLTASEIGHMLHECKIERTNMKDCSETSETTLVQKLVRNSSKSVPSEEADFSKEAGDVVHTVQHDEPESKDGENREVKDFQGNDVELSKNINSGDDSTNEDSGMICSGNLLKNEKQSSREEPKAVSPDRTENVNEDVDSCTAHDGKRIEDDDYGKDVGLERDHCISAVKSDGDQLLPMMCDGPDTVKDCITECNRQVPLNEQLPQADNKEDACHDLQRMLQANGSTLTDERAISEKADHAPSEMECSYTEPAVENSEINICFEDEAQYQKAVLPMSEKSTSSFDGSYADGSFPQTNDSVETGNKDKVMLNLNLSSDDHEDQDTKSVEGEQKLDNTTQKELFHGQYHSPQCDVTKRWEAEVALTKETDLKMDQTNEELDKIHSGVIIPFIGIDTSGEDTAQPFDSHSQDKVKEVVQSQTEIPFISETPYPEIVPPTELCSASQMDRKKAELSAGSIAPSLLDLSETNQPDVSGSESDDRCPTPTLDENPYEYLNRSGPGSTSVSAFCGSKTCKPAPPNCFNRGSIREEVAIEQNLSPESTVNSEPSPHRALHPDLELRTLRVLQSIGKFLTGSRHNDKSSQIDTANMKHSFDQRYIPTYLAPSHTLANPKDKKINNAKPAMVSASTSKELHAEPSGFLISPFKSKLEEVLGVRLQLKKTDSSVYQHYFERMDKLQETSTGEDYRHPHRSFALPECVQAIKPSIDQDGLKATSQTNLSHEPSSYSQRPVMAVKPSKSDESQADCISKDRQIENSVISNQSKSKQTKTLLVTYTRPTSTFLENKTERFKANSKGLSDKQDASELSSKNTLLSDVGNSKFNSDKATFAVLDPLYPNEGKDIVKLNKIPSSSLPVHSLESAKGSSKLVCGNQGFLTNSFIEKVGKTTKESTDQEDCLNTSTSLVDYNDDSIIDDSLLLDPQSSLTCTVPNTGQTSSYSFLEQLSQRCLQDDLTQGSMEQECLIFSEQMKQLLKRSKKGPIRQSDANDKLNLSCASHVTVHFSSLEELEDSVDHLDAPSFVGQKIMVDMSDRKDLADTTVKEKTPKQRTDNPMEHAGISGVTTDCARLYEATMNDICAVKKVPSRPMHFRMDRGYPKTEPRNHFDFCDQMKREMDESFRSNLNSVVKKSCKTKYRFYMQVTSDDAFFEETKAQLEAEGHTAVQPSEFFLGEDSSSSLLIILRNEDIAEHLSEVPHLLELKKSPCVHFAGIDEPDDVLNLTHQELLTRGGFIMFDRAALEPLSLSKMRKMSEILQELSRTGKWKWMLHYRDSRRLKENARSSAEAKEKKDFLNRCQEAGIMEVLPYHECDLMSRDQPDYLTCLVHLQVQNISARYPIFITDTAAESTFQRTGILTMTFSSFLACSPSYIFAV